MPSDSGSFYLHATAKDALGNATQESRQFLLDNEAPIITIIGDLNVMINGGSTYIDLGATATDNIDNDVELTITGGVNPNILGTYTITYTAKDDAGNEAIASRIINVIDAEAPVITIIGDNPTNIFVDSIYVDAGATAIDDVDGDVTDKIIKTGSVNTSIPGVYTITYTVSDEVGNTSSSTRIVNVIDNVKPIVVFEPNGNNTYAQNHSTKVTVSDTHSSVDTGSLKYLWDTSTTTPDESSFTTTFNNGGTLSPPTDVTGTYYLWILAKDTVGNTTIVSSNGFKLDNLDPTIVFSPNSNSNYTQNHNTKVTANDIPSGINPSSLKYIWQTNATLPSESAFEMGFTNNDTITTPMGVGGSYYLSILAKDNAGNTLIQTSGLFSVDNLPPNVSNITLTTSNVTATSFTINRSGNAVDVGGSGLATNPYIYQISLDKNTWVTKCTNNSTSCNATGLTTGQTYYYRVCVIDNADNQACTNSNAITPVSGYYCGALSGTAGTGDVLSGKTFYNANGLQTGTMPNNGSQSATLTINSSTKPTKTIPAGYTSGGTVTAQLDPSLASSIKQGVNIGGVTGTYTGNPGYKVFTQTSQPSGSAGDIWVKTSATISSIVFESNPYINEEPNASSTTLSIINVYSGSSDLQTITIIDAYNSLVKRKIPYPVIARYGTTATGLNSYEVYLHNGSTWVKISPGLLLYAYGYDPYNLVFKGGYTSGNGTVIKNTTNIYGRAYYGEVGYTAWWIVGPGTTTDITNYTKLKALVKNVGGNYTVGVGISNYQTSFSSAIATAVAPRTQDIVEVSLDISSYTGSYYVMAGMSGNNVSDLRGYVFALWLE